MNAALEQGRSGSAAACAAKMRRSSGLVAAPVVAAITSAFTRPGSRKAYSRQLQPPIDCATSRTSARPR